MAHRRRSPTTSAALAAAVALFATAQAQEITTQPPSTHGLSTGEVAGLVIGLVLVAGALVYGVMYYIKQEKLKDAALSLDKAEGATDAQAYFEAGRQSDDFDAYFGKQPTNTASSHHVKLGSSRSTTATTATPSVAIDINLPVKPAPSRASMSVKSVKLEAVTPPSASSAMATADEAPMDTVAAMRSYRSMIQQQTMGADVAWMSPVESSRSMFASQRQTVNPKAADDFEKLEWMSAMESSRTNNMQAFDTMRSAMDLDLDEEASEASCNTTFNL